MERSDMSERKSKKIDRKGKEVVINSNDFWLNIVDFLQQYWVLIDKSKEDEEVTVYFLNEGSGIFADMRFDSVEIAEKALLQNGFKKYSDPLEKYREYLTPPSRPYYMVRHSEGQRIGS
jgi:hypothetical protein